MSKTLSQVYEDALNLLQDKNKFAQGYYFHDKNGENCPVYDAQSYCVLGAIHKFSDNFTANALFYRPKEALTYRATCILQRVSEHLYQKNIADINDGEDGYEKIMVALKFAKDLWENHEITEEDLTLSVQAILDKRK